MWKRSLRPVASVIWDVYNDLLPTVSGMNSSCEAASRGAMVGCRWNAVEEKVRICGGSLKGCTGGWLGRHGPEFRDDIRSRDLLTGNCSLQGSRIPVDFRNQKDIGARNIKCHGYFMALVTPLAGL